MNFIYSLCLLQYGIGVMPGYAGVKEFPREAECCGPQILVYLILVLLIVLPA